MILRIKTNRKKNKIVFWALPQGSGSFALSFVYRYLHKRMPFILTQTLIDQISISISISIKINEYHKTLGELKKNQVM
jgi:hypothetical protein